jgi:hypothetical protein
MAQTFTFELEGAKELRNMLEVSGKDAGKVVGQVILEEANMIFAKAMILTPIDTGALRGSGGVSAPMNMPQGIGVDIFFGGPAAPYALYVHEILGNYHNPPTQAKYSLSNLLWRDCQRFSKIWLGVSLTSLERTEQSDANNS